MKHLILGGRSYLATKYAKYLSLNNEDTFVLSEVNSNFYSKTSLLKKIEKTKPNIIYDFKFPMVTSDDKKFTKINNSNILNVQRELIEILNNLTSNKSKIIVISSKNVNKVNNLYSQYKKNQENIYKTNLDRKNNLTILRSPSVLGEGDLSENRLTPYFFRNIFQKSEVNLSINSNRVGEFIFINNFCKNLFDLTKNQQTVLDIIKIKYKDLILMYSSILKFELNFNHVVFWNGKKLEIEKDILDQDYIVDLRKLTNWYFTNRYKLNL